MELSYWQSRWRKGNIGFHMKNGYTGLDEHWQSLQLPESFTVLAPLCGKSEDLRWFAEKGGTVTGVDISEIAAQQFFSTHKQTPKLNSFANFSIYSSDYIEIWCGDFLKLPEHKMPVFDLIYDKAALVALPQKMRQKYVEKVISLTGRHTKIMLHGFSYNQNEMNGPPFSVSQAEVETLYGGDFSIEVLEINPLDTEKYQKFKKRGLGSHFIEYLLLLSKKDDRK